MPPACPLWLCFWRTMIFVFSVINIGNATPNSSLWLEFGGRDGFSRTCHRHVLCESTSGVPKTKGFPLVFFVLRLPRILRQWLEFLGRDRASRTCHRHVLCGSTSGVPTNVPNTGNQIACVGYFLLLLSNDPKRQNYNISPVSYGSIAFSTNVFVILHRFLNSVVQNSIGSTCARFIFSNAERSKTTEYT